jgi:transposase InsO family protein
MDKDNKVEPVNHYGLNLYNRHGKLIATEPQLDGLVVVDRILDWAPKSTEYTDIDDSFLLAPILTGHASRHDAEKRMLWHRRLAHVGLNSLEILLTLTNARKMTGKCDCESCIKGTFAWNPVTPMTSHPTEPLQLVYSDICGLLKTAIGEGRLLLLFIDAATRHTDQYILKYKSEALEKFKEWKARWQQESGKRVQGFRIDGGGEYTSKQFAEYLKSEGIIKETPTPYTPQSNGVVERENHTIVYGVQYMLCDAGHSKKYCAFAVPVVVYLKNRTPMGSVVGKTPYEACHGSGEKTS